MKTSGKKNLTRGNMVSNLLTFSVPFLLANLLQALYSAVDLWVIGKFGGGKIGVAAVSNGGELMHLIMSFIMGITTGATVLIGQYFGAENHKDTQRSIGMTLSFSLFTGIAATMIFILLTPFLVRVLNTPAEAQEATAAYIRICSWGIIFIVGYNALAAIFRGFGNSTAPLVFVGVACVCNTVADLILVAGCGMGVAGAALATIFSQAFSMGLALWYLCKGGFGFKLHPSNFRMPLELVSRYLKIGLPIAIQGVLIGFSFLFIVSIVNAMGGDNAAPAAGYGIVNRINGFAMLPAISFSMALAAITAQNIGANKPVRAMRTLYLAIACTMTLGLGFLLLLQFFPENMVALFIDRQSAGAEDVIANGALYARSFSWEYILVPIVFCTNGFFNGCGRTLFSMSNNLFCTFFIRIPVSYFSSIMAGATLYHVGLAAPLASLTGVIIAICYLASGRWRNKRRPAHLHLR
ncbi:MAG: MATE family efflux transporter [Lentisphaeria bacterium]|nr:MATE family efflux transporter [Lentisphaeria bacterium]